MISPDSSSLNVWTWVALLGCALVIPGVILESAEYIVKWGRKKSFLKAIDKYLREPSREEYEHLVKWLKPKILKVESLGFFLLVLGLTIEILGSFESDQEQSKENAILTYRAALLESNNLVLQKELQPRIITTMQLTNFIFLTEKTPKIPISVAVGPDNGDNGSFAFQIRELLSAAHFLNANSNDAWGVLRENGAIAKRTINSQGEIPSIDFMTYATNNSYLIESTAFYELTNGYRRPIFVTESVSNDTMPVYDAIRTSFNQLGITSIWYGASSFVTNGEYEIFINPKNY